VVVLKIKKIFFLIVTVLYSLSSMGQQVALNNGVSIDIPAHAQTITKGEAVAHAAKKFNNDESALKSVNNIHTKYIYKIDDILISLNVFDETTKISNAYLSDLKKGHDILAKKAELTDYTSSLRKINNNSVLTITHIFNNVVYCNFYCLNANNTREITGALHYHKNDAAEAQSVLEKLLNSIKFKD